MPLDRRQIILLAIAFLLPLVFLLVIVLSAALSAGRANTSYDFVYVTCTGNPPFSLGSNCENYLSARYAVEEGSIVEREVPPGESPYLPERAPPNPAARFFLHDSSADRSREMTFSEVQALSLSSQLRSPDGAVIVSQFTRRGLFPFIGSASEYAVFLTRDDYRRQLSVMDVDTPYYPGNFYFLGWVTQ